MPTASSSSRPTEPNPRPRVTTATLPWARPLSIATLERRYKRFLADVSWPDGRRETVHCPNPGSMLGLADPGAQLLLSDAGTETERKLRYTWEAVRRGRTWVAVNTGLANRLAERALRAEAIPALAGYPEVRSEVVVSSASRLDFRLAAPTRRPCYVEVKSVTLRLGESALFPDAVTERGRRHLEELVTSVRRGARGVLLFLVMRNDCRDVRPADAIDPEYGRTLRRAAASGVELLACAVDVTRRGLRLGQRLRVRL
jgi:sugar fermentation stimulation protein A